MNKSLLCTLAAGALIGAFLPSSRPAAPAAPSATATQAERVESRLQRQRDGHFYADATVNGQHVRFIVDTGATTIALSEEDAQRIGIRLDPSRYEDVGRGGGGIVQGQRIMLDSIEIGGKRVENLRGAVIQGGDMSLLGQSYLSQLNSVEIRGDEMVLR